MKIFTVGPVEMYPSTLQVAGQQVPYFRNQAFSQVYLECEALFKEFAGASEDDKFILLTSSGTGALEAVVENCISEQDKVLVVDGGTFGHRFVQICGIHGVDCTPLELPYGQALSAEHLAPYDGQGYTHVLVNLDETSTGQLYDKALLSEFCQRNGAFFVVDAISAFTADPMSMAADGMDIIITGSQKGLSLSPGLALVLVSKRLFEARVAGRTPRSLYFDFNDYVVNGVRGQTPFTPAVGIVYELQERLRTIKAAGGIQAEVARTAALAQDFRARIADLPLDVPAFPLSNAVTPILVRDGSAKQVCARLEEEYGFVVNPCGGEMADTALRIGHMGNLTKEDNAALVAALKEILSEA